MKLSSRDGKKQKRRLESSSSPPTAVNLGGDEQKQSISRVLNGFPCQNVDILKCDKNSLWNFSYCNVFSLLHSTNDPPPFSPIVKYLLVASSKIILLNNIN